MNVLYAKSIDGIPKVSSPIEKMAEDYLEKAPDLETAVKKMIDMQVVKCTTSGFLTGLGGIATLPVAIPANLSSVLYVQLRMIACAATMAGYDTRSDQVQTLVYACLAGVSMNEFIKQAGIKVGEKLAAGMIKKIPGEVLVKINQKVGFRLLTKFGEKGIVNFGKVVPVVGGVINGGLDLAETKVIGTAAYNLFVKGDLSATERVAKPIRLGKNRKPKRVTKK